MRIIVCPCDWEHSPFAHLQCLPRNSKPVTLWDNQDEAFLSIVKELRKVIARQRFPDPPLSNIQRQNRARFLKRVRATWIEGFLDQSLHQAIWLDLQLQEQSDALDNPWRMIVQELDRSPRVLPAGTSIPQVYDEANGELLILGEPGSGKTTLLLRLARTLLDRAEADERHPMPVLFNLSSWAQRQEGLATWLVEELTTKYQVPRQVGQQWVEAGQLLPLLDGLDEVTDSARAGCVQAITTYYHRHTSEGGIPLVICCRSGQYRALSRHLPLQRAVSILPLTQEQIEGYLSGAQGQLEGLRQALRNDPELGELAHRPLMLSILTLAYQGGSGGDPPTGLASGQTMQRVLGHYVKRMMLRRGQLQRWTQEQFLRWLIVVATHLHQRQHTIFAVEDLQGDWLPVPQQRLYGWSLILAFGLLLGLAVLEINNLPVELNTWLFFGWSALSMWLKRNGRRTTGIQPAEAITWSWKGFRERLALLQEQVPVPFWLLLLSGPLLLSGLLFGLAYASITQRLLDIPALLGLLIVWLVAMLCLGLSKGQLSERAHLAPNEGIWRSAKNGVLVGVSSMPIIGLLFELVIAIQLSVPRALFIGMKLISHFDALVSALLFGLAIGLFFGLFAFLQHFLLRILLWQANYLPWNLVPFLDEAADRLLLRKVGGSYSFMHQLLLEYLATRDEPASTESTSPEDKLSRREAKG